MRYKSNTVYFKYLVLCLFCYSSSFSNSIGIDSLIDQGGKKSAFLLLPYFPMYKGYEMAKGGMMTFTNPGSDKSSKEGLNLFYAAPKLSLDGSYSFKELAIEYENRSYDTPVSFSSVAFGTRRISPSSSFKNWYNNKGQDASSRYKPYVAFRLGYKIMEKAPVVGVPAVGQISYTISDDYRFPSKGPNGYQKIPLKGFRAEISFKF